MNKKELKAKINKLRKQLVPLEAELNEIREKEVTEEMKVSVGKCFVWKNNSYSCPQNPEDYWDSFMKMVSITEDSWKVITFDKDAHGAIKIEEKLYWYSPRPGPTSWQEIPAEEAEAKFKELIKELEEKWKT